MSGRHVIPAQIICRKRDGDVLSAAEIKALVAAYAAGRVPDYQMAAWAMAVYFQGMTTAETVALTQAMLESGTTLDWPESTVPRVDKHSTGGIGDKISLILAPLLACCGLHVPMVSGRGLGITGGTLDKLESIPGFRTDLSTDEIVAQCCCHGCVITGASDQIAPADRKLYRLRDVTGTVPSPPLIVASILSKKLTEGLSSLVLDVKCGRGAFAQTIDEARTLARSLVAVGGMLGLRTMALITNMDQPLGRAVGNALEVVEAMNTLRGQGPDDVLELTLRLGSELLLAESQAATVEQTRQRLLRGIDSGEALEKFEQMVAAQGGRLKELPTRESKTITATSTGYVRAIDAERIGRIVIELGGGRKVMSDRIDPTVGLELLARVGDAVEVGQPIARLYGAASRVEVRWSEVFKIGADPPSEQPLFLDRVA